MILDKTSAVYEVYDLVSQQYVSELSSDALVFEHKKTKARVFILSNQDENKTFYVAFKTLPVDDTGVMHILEHTVLCGSKKYPVRDPFVELCKGSLNNFLNAMTYPDKTMYPFATVNDQDYKNIMDIYMDAVFNPRIKDIPYIFMQEGWHYEISEELDKLDINGVVYNEMKGVFSSPDGYLDRLNIASVYKNGPYRYESGGAVESIPKLTYEQYKDTYDKFYHPSNSYIYMYGDMDYEERLLYLDSEYLSKYEQSKEEVKLIAEPVDKETIIESEYPIGKDEYTGENDYLVLNYALTDCDDQETRLAVSMLDSIIGDSSLGRVREALIKAGIGSDVYTSFDTSLAIPVYSIVAKDTAKDKLDDFRRIISEELDKLYKGGIDKEVLESSLAHFEFRFREADFGKNSKGLMYGIAVMDTWAYGGDPVEGLTRDETFESCKDKLKTDYYEELLYKCFIDNKHVATVVLKASLDKAARDNEDYDNYCKDILSRMSMDDRRALLEENKALLDYQNHKDTEEELSTIPLLKISDIKREITPAVNEIMSYDGHELVYHELDTNGVSYLKFLFDMNCIDEDDYKYVYLASVLMGELDTKNYSYAKLNTLIYLKTGDIFNSIATFDNKDSNQYLIKLVFQTKYLKGRATDAIELLKEEAFETLYTDKERIRDILEVEYSDTKEHYMAYGNRLAMGLCRASMCEGDYMLEKVRGYDFFCYLGELLDNYDERIDSVIDNIKSVYGKVISSDYMIDYAGSKEGLTETLEALKSTKQFEGKTYPGVLTRFTKKNLKLALTTASKVNYNCMIADSHLKTKICSGSDIVLAHMLNYGYIWHNIRELGGAYGCNILIDSMSNICHSSFRDPKIGQSYDIYRGTLSAIESLNPDDRELTQSVIGVMGGVITPLSPADKARNYLAYYISGVTEEMRQKQRCEVLDVTVDKLKEALVRFKDAYSDVSYVTVGNKDQIMEQSDLYDDIRPIISVGEGEETGDE